MYFIIGVLINTIANGGLTLYTGEKEGSRTRCTPEYIPLASACELLAWDSQEITTRMLIWYGVGLYLVLAFSGTTENTYSPHKVGAM